MGYNCANDKPILLQLADVIKSDIVSGKFKITEKLPSVRDFAFEFGVNPNTVQKALQILEDDGLIITDRTNGKFVAGSTDKIEAQKSKTIMHEIDVFVEKMKSLGLNLNEIKNIRNDRRE